MRKLKLLLTDKCYRRITLERLKLKFLSLPVIEHIVAWHYAYKMYKKMKDKSRWEQYVMERKLENDSQKFNFECKLFLLEIEIMAEGINEESFQKAKSDVLCSELINEPDLKEFKAWLENIDSTEKDYSKVQEVLNSFTNTEN